MLQTVTSFEQLRIKQFNEEWSVLVNDVVQATGSAKTTTYDII